MAVISGSQFLDKQHTFLTNRYTFLVLSVIFCSLMNVFCKTDCNGIPCYNGICNETGTNTCECLEGWAGTSCNFCSGRIRLNATSGVITEAIGNYSEDNKCMWLLEPDPPGAPIHLKWHKFATECGWDHLYIFNGDSVFSPLIAAYSGLVQQELDTNSSVSEILADSGKAYLYFYSDAAYNMTGFHLNYTVGTCINNCSGHGDCTDSVCACESGYKGDYCQTEICLNNCTGHGTCKQEECVCDSDFKGEDCSLEAGEQFWTRHISSNSPPGRASPASVLIGQEIWITGGYSFGKQIDFIIVYNIETKEWRNITPVSEENPKHLYGHSMVHYKNCLYVYGGVAGQHIESRLWIYNMTENEWSSIIYDETLAIAGHTAVIVDSIMYIIFGHSPVYGYMNRVYRIDLDSVGKEMTSNGSTGALIDGGYGSSSVYVEQRGEILVYGGYISTGSTNHYMLTDKLYSYNPRNSSWKILAQSLTPRYLHSAVLYGNQMLVFGGNTHNDTSISFGAKCYSLDFLAYDIDCNSWRKITSAELPVQAARYGHVAHMYSGSDNHQRMLVVGGFNGVMLNDVIEYQAGDCSKYTNKTVCISSFPGRACVWTDIDVCMDRETAITNQYTYEPVCNATKDAAQYCSKQKSCGSCLSTAYNCQWCSNNCSTACSDKDKATTDFNQCPPDSRWEFQKCYRLNNCHACSRGDSCFWEGNTKCSYKSRALIDMCNLNEVAEGVPCYFCSFRSINSNFKQYHIASVDKCPLKYRVICDQINNCRFCRTFQNCVWQKESKSCRYKEGQPWIDGIETLKEFINQIEEAESGATSKEEPVCETPCYQHNSCENCTSAKCMWCGSQQRCVETNSYVASFVYGQCKEWTTQRDKCSATRCSDLNSCEACKMNPSCGWCNDASDTGLGKCIQGSSSGPVHYNETTEEYRVDNNICPVSQWHFIECPLCQCNGHSKCTNVSNKCDLCMNLTQGDNCEQCVKGYFGKPSNGGNCTKCDCNDQADTCDNVSGQCYCKTRGVKGDKCNECDVTNNYFGNPNNGGTCYYDLKTDYQFTFNLSKQDDSHYTNINFMNIPPSSDRDVDFTVNCSGLAYLNVTWKSKSSPNEQYKVREYRCMDFRAKFEHKDFNFGPEENVTFFVYIYGFKTPPFWLQISFSQFPKIDLVHFFVTFFSCFIALLFIAAVLYKIKHKYDSYRRAQRMIVEMEEMASRPFATVTLETDRKFDAAESKDTNTDLRKRKRASNKPGQIALEPLSHQKAAVVSLFVQLPTGSEDWTPAGQSGIAIASALVTFGHQRKQSLEHGKTDKIKHKKHAFAAIDTCV